MAEVERRLEEINKTKDNKTPKKNPKSFERLFLF